MADYLTEALAGLFPQEEAPVEPKKSVWDRLNEERAQWRDTIAFLLANPGEGAEGDRGASSLHRVYAKNMTDSLGQVLPATVAGSTVNAAGVGNEALSGALTWLAGKGYYGPKGYDQADIDANLAGINPEVARLQSMGDPGYQTLTGVRAVGQPGISQVASLIQALADYQRVVGR